MAHTTTECSLRRFSPEIRDMIFKFSILNWIRQNQHHESRRLVCGGYGVKYGTNDRSHPLERALIADKGLYREFFSLRIQMSKIRVDITLNDTMIREMSPLARASIRNLELSVRQFKPNQWPQSSGLQGKRSPDKKIRYLLKLANLALSKDLLLAPGTREITIDMSKSFLAFQDRVRCIVDEHVKRHFLNGKSLQKFLTLSQNLTTINLACAWLPWGRDEIRRRMNMMWQTLSDNLQGFESTTFEEGMVALTKYHTLTWKASKRNRLSWIIEDERAVTGGDTALGI